MKIRKATTKDFPVIQKLIREHKVQLMQDHLPKPRRFFLAEKGGIVVGCCALDIYSKRLAEIRSLAVTKKHQSNGIARVLVERCIKEAKKKKIYELIAISGADTFFSKFGFRTFHQEKYALINILG